MHPRLRPCRRHRVRLVWLTLAALLLQQFALAAHACELIGAAGLLTQASDHCETAPQTPQAGDALCAKHCAPDRAAAGEATVAKLPLLLLVPTPPLTALQAAPATVESAALPGGVDPPPMLRFCSLLI